MTQENSKQLLLKDLCARLPYKIKISIPKLFTNKEQVETLNEIFKGNDDLYRVNDSGILIENIKPYLFPLSNMTEEQEKEYRKVCELDTETLSKHPMDETPFPALYNYQDWLNKNNFDYRGLIPMGLAIDATNLNIY